MVSETMNLGLTESPVFQPVGGPGNNEFGTHRIAGFSNRIGRRSYQTKCRIEVKHAQTLGPDDTAVQFW